MVDAVRFYRPDVLSAQWSYEFAAAALDADIPTLITVRDHAPTILRMKPNAYRLLRAILNSSVLQRGDNFSVTSPYMKAMMPSSRRSSVWVIPNFYGAQVAAAAQVAAIKRPAVVTVGNGFDRRKNVSNAIQAFSKSLACQRGWTYDLIGRDFESGGVAERWARRRRLDRGLRFHGSLPYGETLRIIQSASIMLHPALEESFGMTVLEAMVLGTPVIGGRDSGNVPDLLAGGAGKLCDIRSSAAIAAELDHLVGDLGAADEMGARARYRAAESFNAEVAVDTYLAALRNIASAG